MRCFVRLSFYVGFGLFGLVGGADPVYGQYQNYLSPGMEYETMALANISFMLSQAQQNAALQYIPLQLTGGRRRDASPPAVRRSPGEVSAGVGSAGVGRSARSSRSGVRDYSATDFRPRRRRSVADQFAALAPDPSHRGPLQEFGRTVFNALENSSEFRRNNLTYAVGVAIGAALGIECGRELTDDESYAVLDTVHEFLTTGSDVMRRSPEEQTVLYDTCVLFTGLMVAFDTDAKVNGAAASRRAARDVARATLKAFGLKFGGGR